MCSITHASFLALGTAVVAAFVFGFLWYGPLFGKTWAGLMGFKMDSNKCGKPPASSLLLSLLGTVSTVFILAYILGNCQFCCHVSGAFMVWIGFYVPLMLGSVIWEQKPWKLFFLNAVYAFLSLQLIAAIITYVK